MIIDLAVSSSSECPVLFCRQKVRLSKSGDQCFIVCVDNIRPDRVAGRVAYTSKPRASRAPDRKDRVVRVSREVQEEIGSFTRRATRVKDSTQGDPKLIMAVQGPKKTGFIQRSAAYSDEHFKTENRMIL